MKSSEYKTHLSWKNPEFANDYTNESDYYLPFRRYYLEIIQSFYSFFIKENTLRPLRVLDLGTGNDVIAGKLFEIDNNIEMTVVDGSDFMINEAKKQLKNKNVEFVRCSLESLKSNLNHTYDFVVSSLAIHHLTLENKIKLFSDVYDILRKDAFFLNYDAVLADSTANEKWYLALWDIWIEKIKNEQTKKKVSHIPRQYKENPENQPDTLNVQLNALKAKGFRNVECYFKYGIFSMFGGQK